ncbi:MAG: CAP domain-containing protein [Patescibacteria group bacterium]
MKEPKLTERKRLLFLAGEMAALGATIVILLVFVVSSLDALLIKDGQGAAVITSVLADLVNTDRSINKIGTLTVNPTLTAIAQAKANDMAEKGYFAHVSPEGNNPWYWFKQGGYLFTYAGENLAVDFSDSADVEQAWMKSPTHRANILNDNFTEVGIATAVGTYEGHQTIFVVQEFGTPAHLLPVAPETTEVTKPASATEIAIATRNPDAAKLAIVKATPSPATTTTTASSSAVATTEAGPSEDVLGTSATGIATAPTTVERLGLVDLWNVFAASPRTTLTYAYYLFGIILLIGLVIETGIEIRRHHMRHVALVLALIVLMSGLYLFASMTIFTEPVLAEAGASLGL